MYGKERYGTVPGAVATGSMAPGRYRSQYHMRQDKRLVCGAHGSQYCTASQLGRLNESPDTVHSFAIRSKAKALRCSILIANCKFARRDQSDRRPSPFSLPPYLFSFSLCEQ